MDMFSTWEEICKGYCKKFGLKVLYIKEWELGFEAPNGSFGHIDVKEMERRLKGIKKGV